MKIVTKRDEDLKRWPIGRRFSCSGKEGCGTEFEIEGRDEWYERTMMAGGGAMRETFYQSPYAQCPNCAREVYLSKSLEDYRAEREG